MNERNFKEIDGNIHVVPEEGKEHFENKDCWCHPELSYKDADTLIEVWVHKGYEKLNQ